MKVASYDSDPIPTAVVNQPLASGNVPQAAFGAPIAQGVADIANAYGQMKQRISTTSAEEAVVNFERDKNNLLFNPENGYFNTQGKSAFDSAELTNKELEKLKAKYSDGLTDQQAKVMFDRVANNHLTRAQVDISRHASQGLQAWEVATLESQVENSIENAALYWGDPKSLKVQNALGRQAIIDAGNLQGVSAETLNERLQTYDSSFARTAVASATKKSSSEGKALMGSMGDRLEPQDKIKLDEMITVKMQSEKTQADAQYAVITANALVGKYDSREQMIDEIEQIKDIELRGKVMTETMHQFNLKKQAESEARASAFESAESHIINGGSAETFKVQNPDDWLRLSAKQQQTLESGKIVSTEWNTFSDLMTMPKDQLAKVDPTDYFDKLAPSERSKLISAVRSAKGVGSASQKADAQVGRTRSAEINSTVERIYGAKPKFRSTDAWLKKTDEFRAMLDEEISITEQQKGSPLTSEEFTKVLAGFTRKVTIERKIFRDAELDITDIPQSEIGISKTALRLTGQAANAENLISAYYDLETLKKELKARGKPTDSETLLKAYQMGVVQESKQ